MKKSKNQANERKVCLNLRSEIWNLSDTNQKQVGIEVKHGITFEEAITCFYDPLQVVFDDPDHNKNEEREIMIAHSKKNRLLLVCYTIS